ncbi:MAG: putative tRNA threonylcarbamoyladenosine biosynthesis protein Gcp [candidate division WS6 bacterium 34_10]|jgi:N6-L-threonylcarbamoyladenine synthase|uniref:tRNA N6-adenosine threonylcarbamoyltransferase n=1 Tax=candidate division WS6 bacterium 34_10 TaxID=1641389 RepID=A0A101HFD8_9BACT|nr:MAG: putative tRNA threonylcarbamoyladenosine biosynthesis protein Gcp [candidate division WS6 bacterium 34_10]
MDKKQPLILAFDTSCDDTSVAVLKGRKVLSSVVSSQVDIHAEWGGVVPDIARREHEKNIPMVYDEALKKAKVSIEEIDYIASTYGPGLAIDLEIGLNFAKDLAIKYLKPFIPINHMEAHLLSGLLENSKGKAFTEDIEKVKEGEGLEELFPAIGLLISGKHTELIYVEEIGKYKKLGQTLDDAVGEAFDKVGRILNFGYPGGPTLTEFAKKGKTGVIEFPIPMKNSNDLNFSYSGLKTAALYKTKELREEGRKDKEWVYDFCRGFLDAIEESLIIKLESAIQEYEDVRSVFVGGGVFNSEEILREIGRLVRSYGLNYVYPAKEYRGDNAAMIGLVGYYKAQSREYLEEKKVIEKVDRVPRLSF